MSGEWFCQCDGGVDLSTHVMGKVMEIHSIEIREHAVCPKDLCVGRW